MKMTVKLLRKGFFPNPFNRLAKGQHDGSSDAWVAFTWIAQTLHDKRQHKKLFSVGLQEGHSRNSFKSILIKSLMSFDETPTTLKNYITICLGSKFNVKETRRNLLRPKSMRLLAFLRKWDRMKGPKSGKPKSHNYAWLQQSRLNCFFMGSAEIRTLVMQKCFEQNCTLESDSRQQTAKQPISSLTQQASLACPDLFLLEFHQN
ncbi:hypothetical protein EGR_04015 [Echinococcus granulosus]|uniref:Uncharacterized protein n=1 Tax=Echinococcus granulosus TaxID=6210 RepID=W6US29_ECHGR|nr:hypothetical protein EGR_04015 [Echinococcus granulosus]EUB61167.1 hypothetical protein EGR_04015 [Echinococcus granulosus]